MEYKAIFDRKKFDVAGKRWIARVENLPDVPVQGTDKVLFSLRFADAHSVPDTSDRRLELWASHAGIEVENHVPRLHECVRTWLQGSDQNGKVECFK